MSDHAANLLVARRRALRFARSRCRLERTRTQRLPTEDRAGNRTRMARRAVRSQNRTAHPLGIHALLHNRVETRTHGRLCLLQGRLRHKHASLTLLHAAARLPRAHGLLRDPIPHAARTVGLALAYDLVHGAYSLHPTHVLHHYWCRGTPRPLHVRGLEVHGGVQMRRVLSELHCTCTVAATKSVKLGKEPPQCGKANSRLSKGHSRALRLSRLPVPRPRTMLQSTVPHFDTGGFTSHRTYLSDKEYGEALDCIVKGCTDILITCPKRESILLGKRKVQPQPDWWFVGGRIFPGETPAVSCCRLLKRELQIDVAPGRLEPICCQSLAWAHREQTPKHHGTTDIQVAHTLCLLPGEEQRVVLDPKEYFESKWVPIDSVLHGDYHPALKFAVRSLVASVKLRQLRIDVETLSKSQNADALIANRARELVSFLAGMTPQPGVGDYRVRAPHLDYEAEVTCVNEKEDINTKIK